MEISGEAVTKNFDELIAAADRFEEQLAQAGFVQAHDWMFHLREILFDLRRFNLRLADLFNTADPRQQAPALLRSLGHLLRDEIGPHVQWHVGELEANLDVAFPEPEDPQEPA